MANDEQAQAVIDWVNGAPLGELATELMAAFAPQAAGRPATGAYLNHLGAWLFRGYTRPQRHAADVVTPVREAVQLLEQRRTGLPRDDRQRRRRMDRHPIGPGDPRLREARCPATY